MGAISAGEVTVVYGSAVGLAPATGETWSQGGVLGEVPELVDRFGLGLAAGDFDGDGKDDLAIGVPFEDYDGPTGVQINNAGIVHVIYGSASGLAAAGAQVFRKGQDGVLGEAGGGDRFGIALAAADFDGDGFADLAIGSDGAESGGFDSGGVHVIYGSPAGLVADGGLLDDQFFTQEGLGFTSGPFDRFGAVLAVGDFDPANASKDLIIGAPEKDVDGLIDAGAAFVVYGTETGLDNAGAPSPLFLAGGDPTGFPPEADAIFGQALAAGDFDGDGDHDLAIGEPFASADPTGENVPTAGRVHVFWADGGQVQTSEATHLDRSDADGLLVEDDRFGSALAAADFEGDGRDELAIGGPRVEVDFTTDAGVVFVLGGSADGDLPLRQTVTQVLVDPAFLEPGDRTGEALTVGDFDGSGVLDLAIGLPSEDGSNPLINDGAVLTIPSIGLYADDFEHGNTDRWSNVVN